GVLIEPRTETGMVTFLVTPWIVRSPVTLSVLASFACTAVLVKERVGNFCTSKKSGDFRWLLRSLLSVSIDAAWTVKATLDTAGFCLSYLIVPSKSLKRPGTVETKWRTLKPTELWSESTL